MGEALDPPGRGWVGCERSSGGEEEAGCARGIGGDAGRTTGTSAVMPMGRASAGREHLCVWGGVGGGRGCGMKAVVASRRGAGGCSGRSVRARLLALLSSVGLAAIAAPGPAGCAGEQVTRGVGLARRKALSVGEGHSGRVGLGGGRGGTPATRERRRGCAHALETRRRSEPGGVELGLCRCVRHAGAASSCCTRFRSRLRALGRREAGVMGCGGSALEGGGKARRWHRGRARAARLLEARSLSA